MGNQPYPGYPGNPKKPKTGLIIGLVTAGVLVVGGIVTLVLILTGKNDAGPTAAAPTSSQGTIQSSVATKLPPSGSPGGSGGGNVSPDSEVVGKDAIAKINAGDAAGIKPLICPAILSAAEPEIQKIIDQKPNITFESMQEASGVAVAVAKGTVNGQPNQVEIYIRNNGDPCILGGFIGSLLGQ